MVTKIIGTIFFIPQMIEPMRLLRILLFVHFAYITFAGYGQTRQAITFDQLTTEDGLSHNQISSIYEDQRGFIWVGTLSGLNLYDGYHCQTLYHNEDDINSVASNTILWVANGPEGKIWIKNGDGMSIYDLTLEKFISSDPWLTLLGASSFQIQEILIDSSGAAWFNIDGQGLKKVLPNSREVFSLTVAPESTIQITSNNITDMAMDDDGNIWTIDDEGHIDVIDTKINNIIRKFDLSEHTQKVDYLELFVDSDRDIWIHSTDDQLGLLYVNTTSGVIRKFDERDLSSRVIRDVIQVGNGAIWVGTDHGGISVIDKGLWDFQTLKYQSNNSWSLSHNSITTMLESRNGIVWVGKTKNGVSYHNEKAGKFSHYRYNEDDPAFNDMSSMAEDVEGDIWIGTNGKGLLKFDADSKQLKKMEIFGNETSSIGSNVIVSLFYASDQSLWIGTYLQGLFRYRNNQLERYEFDGGKTNSVSENNIWSIFEDSNKDIWIGTLQSGLDKFDRETETFSNYNQDRDLTVNYITRMVEDNQQRLWIATGQGLTVHDLNEGTFQHFLSSDSIDHPISGNSVIALLHDSKGQIWAGTMSGLNLYVPEMKGFKRFMEKNGLSSDIIMALLEDDNGNIWVSTAKGISKMTFADGQTDIETFDKFDGLQADLFNENAALKTKDGMLIFAGQNGFNMFDPNTITVNDQPPSLSFTDFYLNSRKVIPGEVVTDRIILERSIGETDYIDLNHEENSFAFEFVALTFDGANKNKYQCMLEGFDEDWVDVSSDVRMANYTNLDAGRYTFKVRAANNHNKWNLDGVAVSINISPPFWKTPLAYILYVLVLFLVLYFTRKAIIRRERLRAGIENERLQSQRVHELDLMKLKLFTNISHEFRTPISLVLTPIERMIKHPDKVKVSDFQLIQRNAKRLLTLVNQLLDFRKMEANQHMLYNSTGDLIQFMQSVVESFSDMSREKDIQLIFESELSQFFTSFDKDKMDKIMFNLLSNAFKFTLPGGKIILDVEKMESDNILISVTDTGIGVPKEKQNVIFERFMQNEPGGNAINTGTGIGLSITKEFVELHNGKITIESEPDHGSTFSIELPFKQMIGDNLVEKEEMESLLMEALPQSEYSSEKPNVFLVEDNADFLFYLKDNLRQYFNISESYNGKEAWKSICNTHPDIVISDVTMPVMGGLELCRKIKNDPRTSDIPVILLTAQSSDDSKIVGLEAGAIEYISKPFNFEILVSTINSALKFQKRVSESNRKIKVEPGDIEIVSRDEKLIKDALELVEKNIPNAEFSVEEMSHQLGYSRGHLYQRMLKITGESPMDFIRNIRMKRAAEYLEKSQMTVSEVAYKVGYNNPKLFSRYFKSQYKMYPSQYIAQFKAN